MANIHWKALANVAKAARPPAASARRGERGVALLLALLTMVLLAVVVTEFTFSTQVQYRRAKMWLEGRRAGLLAQGGVMLAGEVLREDTTLGTTDSLTDIWARQIPPIDTGAGMLSVRIEDEQSKLNLNGLTTGSKSNAALQLRALLQRLGLDPSLATPVADWVDKNTEPSSGPLAAESEWYETLRPPYEPRNGLMRSFAELALVRGFTPDVIARLRPFVTVLPSSDVKVNVNTASAEVLRSVDPRLDDESLVRRIIETRTTTPFTKAATLAKVEGMSRITEAELDRLFGFTSRFFRVRSTGDADGAMRSAEALMQRDSAIPKIVYLLPRRGPNIVGLDTSFHARIDDRSFLSENMGGNSLPGGGAAGSASAAGGGVGNAPGSGWR